MEAWGETLSVAVLSVLRTKVNFICGLVKANVILEMYLIFPSPCVFQGSFVTQNREREREGWSVGKSTQMLFFSTTDKKQQFLLKRRHKAKCSGAASKEYKVQQNPSFAGSARSKEIRPSTTLE